LTADHEATTDVKTGGGIVRTAEPWYLRGIPAWVMPNHLSLMRLGLGVAMLVLDYQGVNLGWLILIGLVAGFSDLLDGALARARNLTSKLGAFLDPIGDKLFAVVLAVIVWRLGHVPAWLFLCFLLCEMHAVVIPVMVLIKRLKAKVPLLPVPKLKVNRWGKVKTAWLASAMGLIMIFDFVGYADGIEFGYINIWIALGLGIIAEYHYLNEFRQGAFD
jgi:phosphatidylglycerophosphate synthase